ncbi:MAG: type II toxin-antitoxin system RelE/ParE family toxin [Pseudomonadota bacterium]
MRIYLTKWFARFARREGIGDALLKDAVARASRGLIDADLGGGLIKQRVARSGRGRSAGYRIIIAYRSGQRSLFMFGFAKSERDNLQSDELEMLKEVAHRYLMASDASIEQLVVNGDLSELR